MGNSGTQKNRPEKVIPASADDATIREALADAHIPSLMLSMVHLTGDLDILRGDVRPEPVFLSDPQDGISPEHQALIREEAFQRLTAARDQGQAAVDSLTHTQLSEMLEFLMGQPVTDEYLEFLTQELSMHGEDPYAQPRLADVDSDARGGFKVIVVGAGMSGLLCGIRLKEAGVPFEIIEKNADVGGTWYENTYPGCRVDSGNHVYSYSFRPKDWPQYFSSQAVLRDYFTECADAYGLRPHIRFNTEVTSARFDESRGVWTLAVTGADGGEENLECNALISAVGQLNRPKLPDLPGVGEFAGPCFHSARWDHDVDVAGKRVGVIGTGGSAFQFVPHLAEDGAEVTVFQRTAPWVVSNEQYFSPIPEGVHWLMNHLPYYAKWFRFSMFWKSAEGLLGSVTAEPGWNRPEHSVSQANEDFRAQLVENMQTHFADDADLLAKCMPDYPPGSKRMLIDDGRWFRTLKRDNVALVTDSIDRITPQGVRCENGDMHEFDVLIYGTGFSASDFLTPMKIYGIDGVELHDAWAGEPRAFKGISFPGFPNLFCCYGPNTNIVVNSSIIFFSECEVRYILGCLAELMKRGPGAHMDVRQDVHDAYNERIDSGNRQMAWGQSSVNTWYKNASGRVTQNWPFTLIEFWRQSLEPEVTDYQFG